MTTFKDFCDCVLKNIPRATTQEREDIRLELTDHLLEHRDMLVDHGVEILEAERRAIEAMGDAAEIGKAWNEKLLPLWLWLGRIAKAVCVLLVICSLQMVIRDGQQVIGNLYIRSQEQITDDGGRLMRDFEPFWSHYLNIRGEFGQHIICIYKAELLEPQMEPGMYYLNLYLVSYAKNPLHTNLDSNILMNYTLCDGERVNGASSGGGRSGYATCQGAFKVKVGQETAHITLDHNGNSFAADIELDWGGVEA